MSERQRKVFWVWTEKGDVFQTEGLSCAPENPDIWWCPKVGCSMAEGYWLFETEQEALEKAIAYQKAAISTAEERLAGLETRHA